MERKAVYISLVFAICFYMMFPVFIFREGDTLWAFHLSYFLVILVIIVPVVLFTYLVLVTLLILSVLRTCVLKIAGDCVLTGLMQESLSGVGFSFRFSFNIVCIKLVVDEVLIGDRDVLVSLVLLRKLFWFVRPCVVGLRKNFLILACTFERVAPCFCMRLACLLGVWDVGFIHLRMSYVWVFRRTFS